MSTAPMDESTAPSLDVRAYRVAQAITVEADRNGLPVALLAGVAMVENPDLLPRAVSSAGARGIFQLMPLHAGRYRCASKDLEDIASNVCHGVRLLAELVQRHEGNVATALLRYNGCVRGTRTADCHRYPVWVLRRSGEVQRALTESRAMTLPYRGGAILPYHAWADTLLARERQKIALAIQ
jgi:soluble lytic murein transglycosylase-like protein